MAVQELITFTGMVLVLQAASLLFLQELLMARISATILALPSSFCMKTALVLPLVILLLLKEPQTAGTFAISLATPPSHIGTGIPLVRLLVLPH